MQEWHVLQGKLTAYLESLKTSNTTNSTVLEVLLLATSYLATSDNLDHFCNRLSNDTYYSYMHNNENAIVRMKRCVKNAVVTEIVETAYSNVL